MADLTPTLTLSSLQASGAPPSAVRTIKQWAEQNLKPGATGYDATVARAKLHATEFAKGVRSTGEGTVFGGLLGVAHGLLPQGLDMPIPGTKMHLPLDGAGALLGLLAGTFAAAEPFGIGRTLTNGGASCATVYSFRKVNDMMIAMKERKAGFVPNSGIAPLPGRIGKATFTGEGGMRGVIGSRGHSNAAFGEDPIVTAARNL